MQSKLEAYVSNALGIFKEDFFCGMEAGLGFSTDHIFNVPLYEDINQGHPITLRPQGLCQQTRGTCKVNFGTCVHRRCRWH
jgi:hypothetical protein